MNAPYFALVIWNERMSFWIEIASSFERAKLDPFPAHLKLADVSARVIACADDSDAAIASAVSLLPAPAGSFAGDVDFWVDNPASSRCLSPRLPSGRKPS